jgi:D-alanine-D-alanine ligase
VIGNAEPEVSVPGEIIANAEWYDYEAKYEEGGMQLRAPAELDPETTERVRKLAAFVYRAVDNRGLARCDFFVREDGEVLVNEINTIPGFTETSVYARLFEASGIPYAELLQRLIDLALERHERRSTLKY